MFLNFNCVILNVVEVTIGDLTQIGPGVQILVADHPRDPALRASGLEFGARSGSGAMSGSGRGRSSCPVSPSMTMRGQCGHAQRAGWRDRLLGNPARVRSEPSVG